MLIVPAFGYPGDDCRLSHKRGKRAEATSCFQKLTSSSNPSARAEGFWGLGQFQAGERPNSGPLLPHRPQMPMFVSAGAACSSSDSIKAEAHQLFKEALDNRCEARGAMLGMALVASEGFDKQAVEFAAKALESRSEAARSAGAARLSGTRRQQH